MIQNTKLHKFILISRVMHNYLLSYNFILICQRFCTESDLFFLSVFNQNIVFIACFSIMGYLSLPTLP